MYKCQCVRRKRLKNFMTEGITIERTGVNVIFGEDAMFRKKKAAYLEYDRENQIPILKCSICNGEQIAGFKDIHSGKFQEVMLIRSQQDLSDFLLQCGINDIKKEY